ncbi:MULTISPECIES: M23 family metallopeptidase [Corynebacterium]|uniref:M23 family metallopeptidase n=2 Tax=Corynebacterium TaxID=1716 RepID=A0A7W2ED42_9CORY|nr:MULTISPECIES: M23 family metallopeptidase [Corynebacterium]MBA5245514.1 M23 family metallopeptidase [Corynebacterium haemomassiliense]MCG7288516.1 M23 family metallopeptidase [Corynebacterium sp. ACRPZ]MCG7293177.1 M23 family metallopeptidase [Corynebacterium sp. ACRPY]MCZ9291468.1 M23 family metallopeptidase [Corynebacterium lehmanniae]
MFNSTKQGGKHRKQSPNKGRVAVVAAATGAVSTAGFSGLVAGALTSNQDAEQGQNIKLAADADELQSADPGVDEASAEETPQILSIAEYKPVENLTEQLDKAIQHSDEVARLDEAARAPLFTKPAEGAFTSGFGMRWGSMHNGVDIANTPGTPIRAVAAGTVIDSGPAQGFGNWIRIRHEDGSISVYGHMQSLYVAVGEVVQPGQLIAGMGSEGFSTGSHLHFEIWPDGASPSDPAPWLAARGINL